MLTLAFVSTPLQLAVSAVPSFAGFGDTVQLAAVGAVLSKVNAAVEVAVLPATSLVVAVSSPVTSVPAVAVQVTVPLLSVPQE